MNEYQQQAINFLTETNTTMTIEPIGMSVPKWEKSREPHATYKATLSRNGKSMEITFYDSLNNTEKLTIDCEGLAKKMYKMHYNALNCAERSKVQRQLKQLRKEGIPNEYDIIACLQKYDVGTMEDFFHEFGYEITCPDDMFFFHGNI